MELFSDTLPSFDEIIANDSLKDTLSTLMDLIGESFKAIKWDENYIGIPVKLNVDLPSRGNFQEIDIRSEEPVILVFDIYNYPSKAPRVISNRLDFPKNRLAHLYIAKAGCPPAFCYIKGDRDNWYANKRIEDLLVRISNWLRDAAAGELTENGQMFDPLRLEGYSGTVIYDYDRLAKLVHEKNAFVPGLNFAVGLFERDKTEESISFKLIEIMTSENEDALLKKFQNEKNKEADSSDRILYHLGYVLWSDEEQVSADYIIDLPSNWREFKAFVDIHKIDIKCFEFAIAKYDLNYLKYFPVVVGIKRPLNLIGFDSNIEFINFRFQVDTDDVKEGKISDAISIKFQAHNQPLTLSKARQISGFQINDQGRTVVFGCGALGSKIIMHFARSGETEFTLLDPDEISPHNLVRHALDANYEGINKAKALVDSIKKIFPYEKLNIYCGPSFKNGFFEKPDTFLTYKWIFNFTASESFFNRLVKADHINFSKICSASISDFGNLGILLREGADRNPRIDDLRAYLYSFYKLTPFISEWLTRENEVNNDKNIKVVVGVGCNSETTLLSDSLVSSHAACFAGAIRHLITKTENNGRIILNRIVDGNEFSISTTSIVVEPFDILPAVNDHTWSVRFKNGILRHLTKQMTKAGHLETGGILIGVVNHKNKTIHVVDLVSAPPDSRANRICFYRGCHGLPEEIEKITVGSGGQLGYVGEWHSHPKGPEKLSDIDLNTVTVFKKELAHLTTPLPVFLMIVTPRAILPFVY